MDDPVKTILIIKLRAIGDVVLSTSILPDLRKMYPDAQIHFLVEPPADEVLEDNPYVDKVIPYSWKLWKKLSLFRSWQAGYRFIKNLRQQGYDLVFDLFGNPRSAFIAWISGARIRVGYNFRGRKFAYNRIVKARGDRVHEVEFNLDALRAMQIEISHKIPLFYISWGAKNEMRQWFKHNNLHHSFVVGFHVWGSWSGGFQPGFDL